MIENKLLPMLLLLLLPIRILNPKSPMTIHHTAEISKRRFKRRPADLVVIPNHNNNSHHNQCTSTRLDHSLETKRNRKGDFNCNDDPILGGTIGNTKKEGSSLHHSAQMFTSPSLCQAKSSSSPSSKRPHRRQGRSKSLDTLEQTIGQVVNRTATA